MSWALQSTASPIEVLRILTPNAPWRRRRSGRRPARLALAQRRSDQPRADLNRQSLHRLAKATVEQGVGGRHASRMGPVLVLHDVGKGVDRPLASLAGKLMNVGPARGADRRNCRLLRRAARNYHEELDAFCYRAVTSSVR
jgi:hypothetical protein